MKRTNNNMHSNGFKSMLATACAIMAVMYVHVDGQTRKPAVKPRPKQLIRPVPAQPKSEPAEKIVNVSAAGSKTQSVAIVNAPEPEYLSGEARVTVNPQQPTVIRLGLAQNAVSIVEFPASDGIYYIHEGNPKLASVFQSPTKETDRWITIYPGEAFLPSKDSSTSAAISLQMRSGLVLILELVPVSEIRRNAHRCVITYDRNAVISARKVAGLAFDLGGDSRALSPVNSRAASKLVGVSPPIEPTVSEISDSEKKPILNAVHMDLPNASRTGSKRRMSEGDISKTSNKRLADVLRDTKKHLGNWSSPHHGLELATTRASDLDSENRLVIVAIRNSTTSNLRLVSGSPELQIQTLDKDGNSLLTSKLDIRYLETTALEGLVLPGSTTFYALVYKTPTLGTNQKVRVIVAHKEAADAPVTAALSGSR